MHKTVQLQFIGHIMRVIARIVCSVGTAQVHTVRILLGHDQHESIGD